MGKECSCAFGFDNIIWTCSKKLSGQDLCLRMCRNLPSCSSWTAWRKDLCPWCRSSPDGSSQRGRWKIPPLSGSAFRRGKSALLCRWRSATWRGEGSCRWAGWEAWCVRPRRRCTTHPTAGELWQTLVCRWLPATQSTVGWKETQAKKNLKDPLWGKWYFLCVLNVFLRHFSHDIEHI